MAGWKDIESKTIIMDNKNFLKEPEKYLNSISDEELKAEF